MSDRQEPNVDVSELPDDVGVEMQVYHPTVAWLTIPALVLFMFMVVYVV